MDLFVINIIIAYLWVDLTGNLTFQNFVIGLILGFLLILVFQKLFKKNQYIRRTKGVFRFIYKFLFAFLKANLTIAFCVLFKSNQKISPNIITFDVSEMRKPEILLLSHCITLTPGTTTIKISPDLETLFIHAYDASNPDAVRKGIEKELKQPILEFTR